MVKGYVFRRLSEAVESARLGCQVFSDGMSVKVDETTIYEPDAAVRCGTPLDGRATHYDDPIIVVEVLSPSTGGRDWGAKLDDYFRLPSVVHYLIVRAEKRRVIHHARQGAQFVTQMVATGPVVLDPPGLTLDVASLFPPDPA